MKGIAALVDTFLGLPSPYTNSHGRTDSRSSIILAQQSSIAAIETKSIEMT